MTNYAKQQFDSILPALVARQRRAAERESIVFQVSGFPGWYGSFLDQALDSEIERDCEYIATEKDSKYYANEPDSNFNFPEPLKVTESDLSDSYYSSRNFGLYREARNLEWLDSLVDVIGEECSPGFVWHNGARFLRPRALDKRDLTDNESRWQIALAALAQSMRYESMSSPREYNFTTDRLFAYGRLQAFRVMLRLARRPENKAAWSRIVRERHASRDGFCSWYPADSNQWPEHIAEYDHNHLATLLAFALESCGRWESETGRRARDSWDQINDSICDAMLNGEDSAFWTHVQLGDSAIAEIRGRRLCDWLESESADEWTPESPALVWLAANPAGPIIDSAIEHDAAVIRAAQEYLARQGESVAIRCDSTLDLFAGEAE